MNKSIHFVLKVGEDFIPLVQLLKVTQMASSGGEAQMLVLDKKVRLNGEIELRKRAKIRSGDVVTFQGFSIEVSGQAPDLEV
jgi:ribosome-associated protein